MALSNLSSLEVEVISFRIQFASLLVLCYGMILFFVISPKYGWIHPEIRIFDEFTLRSQESALIKTFNWQAYEFVPRMTRPISNFIQVIEGDIRHAVVWSVLPYLPTFSPFGWLMSLLITPLLVWFFLGHLGFGHETKAAGYLLALMAPTNLSHLAIFFRPAKALSEMFFVATAIWYMRLIGKESWSWKDRLVLVILLLLGFLSDEHGYNAYMFIVLFSISETWRRRRQFFPLLIAIPAILSVLYFKLFPFLADYYWNLDGALSSYHIFDKFLKAADPVGAVTAQASEVLWLFVNHLWIFASETFGFTIGPRPEGWGALIFAISTTATFGTFGYAIYRGISGPPSEAKRERNILCLKFLGITVIALFFHSVLISMTSGMFGPWYYAGTSCLMLIFAFSVALQWLPKWSYLLVVTPMLISMCYLHVETHAAMRRFHYYPYSEQHKQMFGGELDRFTLPRIAVDPISEIAGLEALSGLNCMPVPYELIPFLVTARLDVFSSKPFDPIANPGLCRGSACCAPHSAPYCFEVCGHFIR